jgi:hypothetical protein
VGAHGDGGVGGAGVFGGVGEGFGDQEVGGRLQGGGEPAGRNVRRPWRAEPVPSHCGQSA